MDKITILNPHKEPFDVEVVRYFVMGDADILLYTLNEIDNDGNARLYVTKIDNGTTFELTEQEWTYVKATIRNIVQENREHKTLTVRDLDFNRLKGLVVEHLKIFKLAGEVLPDLMANKKQFKHSNLFQEMEPFFEEKEKSHDLGEEKEVIERKVPSANNLFERGYDRPNEFKRSLYDEYQEEQHKKEEIDYKAMYEEIAKEKKKLEEELFDLQSKTVSYQIKYDQIRHILEGEPLPRD